MTVRRGAVSAVLALVLIYPAAGRAQTVNGAIVGVVQDSSGGVVPDVAVAQVDAAETARRLALERIVAAGGDNLEARWALEALRAQATPPKVALQGYVGEYGAIRLSERDGHLLLQRDRRPPWTLLPLGADLFTVADEPGRRVAFERDAQGLPTALEIRLANGQSMRYRR